METNPRDLFICCLSVITDKEKLINLYNTVDSRDYRDLIKCQWIRKVGSEKEFCDFLREQDE